MRQLNDNIIPTQAAASVNSAPIPALNLFAISAQITTVGGAPGGTMKLQASNDDVPGQPPANWSDIASATVTISAIGTGLIPKTEICYQWVRVVYTNTGTGTISVVIKALGD